MTITPTDFSLQEDATIFETMERIDKAAVGGVCVVRPDGHFLGMMTDGDIRRALLDGAGVNDRIGPYVNRCSVTAPEEATRADVLDLMQAWTLQHIPVVDEQGHLVELHTLKQLLGRETRPNWAIVMAGGKGTRLRPITERIPKPMVRVAGRPILERIVLHLISCGIRRIFIAINYLGHIIEESFGDGTRLGCCIEYLREEEPLGTGGAVSLLPERPKHPVLIMNGDLIMQTDLGRMLEFHERGQYYATMGLRPYTHEVAFGCAEVRGHQLIGIEEKPVLQKLINAGTYVLSPRAVADIPASFFPITRLFEDALAGNRACGAFVFQGEWSDIGRPEQLRHANGLGE